jgi:hypothetical protein
MFQNLETTTTTYLTKAEVWMRVAAEVAGRRAPGVEYTWIIAVADRIADAWEERFCEKENDSS